MVGLGSAVARQLGVGQLEAVLSGGGRRSADSLNVGDVGQLERLVTAHQRLVGGRESLWVEVDPTEPIVAHDPGGDGPGDDDVVRGADAGPAAPGSCSVYAGLGGDSEGHDVVLDTAEPFLGPDTVLVLVALDLRQPGVVVALESSCQAGEVLEAARLGRHVVLAAAVLGHLDLPLVVGGVPDGEGDGGSVGLCVGEVQVTVVASVGPTEVWILAVGGGGGDHGLGGGGESHHVRAALALSGGRREGGRQHEQVVIQSRVDHSDRKCELRTT